MKATSPKFKLVLVTCSWNGKMTVKIKDESDNKVYLKEEKARMQNIAVKFQNGGPDYRIVGPTQYKNLLKEVEDTRSARRKAGVAKAAKTRAKNKARGVKPHFICCPTCGERSKMLYSEMGGLQTRVCKRGHRFEYDKWIADRAAWGPILGAGVPNPFRV